MRCEEHEQLLREALASRLESVRVVLAPELAHQSVHFVLMMQDRSVVVSATEDAEIELSLDLDGAIGARSERRDDLQELAGMTFVDFWSARNSQGYLDLCQLQFTDSDARRKVNVQFMGMVSVVDVYIWAAD